HLAALSPPPPSASPQGGSGLVRTAFPVRFLVPLPAHEHLRWRVTIPLIVYSWAPCLTSSRKPPAPAPSAGAARSASKRTTCASASAFRILTPKERRRS